MNVLRKITMGIGGTVVIALAIGLVAPKTAHAGVSAAVTVANTPSNPVPTQEVKESRANFISVSFGVFTGSTYHESLPDGTISLTPFTIPSGEQFVITDVNWITFCATGTGFTCGRSVGDAVVLVLGSDFSHLNGSYMSQSSYFNSGGGGALTAGRSDSLKSGLVVTQLPTPSILFGASGNGENIVSVILRGYLVP